MHPIDRVAAVMIKRGPERLRVFPGGWGDEKYVAQLNDLATLQAAPPSLEISWGPTKHLADRTVRDGRFPAITDVPTTARTATIRIIEPAPRSTRLCLLMAAWNDHGYNTRQQLSEELLKRGVGSLILEIPYYGSRRMVGPDDQPIQTVADFARMGLGAITEGRALLAHFRMDYQMGVSGYSMGGNIGALVGAAAGFPVAMAPLAASHAPGPVFLDGVISNGIQWQALGGRRQEQRLREVLTAASVLRLPVPSWSDAAVMVAARRDGFIPTSAVEHLHQHWAGSELRWQSGGHATLLWRQRAALADAVTDSFDRIEGRSTAPAGL
ncbi:MAG: alpha/beta hydrolase family protein [bacterium]|nr:alpha/beta hydrolase family protein [bacterium]